MEDKKIYFKCKDCGEVIETNVQDLDKSFLNPCINCNTPTNLKRLQNQRNKLNRQISTLKKAQLKQ